MVNEIPSPKLHQVKVAKNYQEKLIQVICAQQRPMNEVQTKELPKRDSRNSPDWVILDPAPTLQPGVCEVINQVTKSSLFKEFHKAFGDLTSLPLALRPCDYWQLPLQMCSYENQFCAIIGDDRQACTTCLEVQSNLTKTADKEGRLITCPFGLVDMAVPVFIGTDCQAFLHTGQMFSRPPTPAKVRRAIRKLSKWNLNGNLAELEQAYKSGTVMGRKQQNAVLQLLTQFSKQLSEHANRIFLESSRTDPPLINRAKQYLIKHHNDPITLAVIAAHLNVSTFYFCKQFKKHVGMRFTDYLARLRIEHAKQILQNPHTRVSEVAFEVGFNSLPHFNRSFKRITGLTPTEFREDTV